MLDKQRVVTARALAEDSTGTNNAANIPMIVMTTSNSINVKARLILCVRRHDSLFVSIILTGFVQSSRRSPPPTSVIYVRRMPKEDILFSKSLIFPKNPLLTLAFVVNSHP